MLMVKKKKEKAKTIKDQLKKAKNTNEAWTIYIPLYIYRDHSLSLSIHVSLSIYLPLPRFLVISTLFFLQCGDQWVQEPVPACSLLRSLHIMSPQQFGASHLLAP